MPDLEFQVTGVDAAVRSLAPLVHFKLRITNSPVEECIQAALITAQIQIQCPQRNYSPAEKEKLIELFGPPELWGQSLRNRLWAHANTTVRPFSGSTETILEVPCTADLNVTASKYFYALDGGEVSLLFLFSGSVFYSTNGLLQVSPISWNQECVYRMDAQTWSGLMARHYPNTSWLSLRKDVFEQLYSYKRQHSLMSWEDTIESLLRNQAELAETTEGEELTV